MHWSPHQNRVWKPVLCAVQGLCACIWDKIEAEVPPNDFAALERLPGPEREAHPLMAQINEYSFACARQLETEPAPTP